MQDCCIVLVEFYLTFADVILVVQQKLKQIFCLSLVFCWRAGKYSIVLLLKLNCLASCSGVVHKASTGRQAVA